MGYMGAAVALIGLLFISIIARHIAELVYCSFFAKMSAQTTETDKLISVAVICALKLISGQS